MIPEARGGLQIPAELFPGSMAMNFPQSQPLLLAILLLPLYFFSGTWAQSAQDIGQLFQIDRIVPDLLPAFNPTVLFQVTYNATVIPGQILSQNGTKRNSL
jgi:hypothetical protein